MELEGKKLVAEPAKEETREKGTGKVGTPKTSSAGDEGGRGRGKNKGGKGGAAAAAAAAAAEAAEEARGKEPEEEEDGVTLDFIAQARAEMEAEVGIVQYELHSPATIRVQGPGSRVQGPGSKVQGPGSRVQGPGSRV